MFTLVNKNIKIKSISNCAPIEDIAIKQIPDDDEIQMEWRISSIENSS